MKNFSKLALASSVGIAVAFMGALPALSAQKLTVAHSTWIGYGALYIAKEKGFFDKAGLDVNLKIIEASSDALAAMQGGQIDVVASTIDNFTLFAGNGANLTLLTTLDESSGGDGIVSRKDIKSVADLKGHSVGVQKGSISQFLLAEALDKAGLTLNDVKTIDMKSGDAGAAFVAGSIDAAVTWQPWLSKAAATSFGKVLIDTKSMPGLIVDALATRSDFAKDHEADFKAFVKAYFEGVAFMKTDPAAANEIIARNLKMSKETLEASLGDVRFISANDNETFFTGSESPAVKLVTNAGEFYHRIGVLRKVPDAQKLVGVAPELAK
ncbi:aliphatic sulfonate ABC transporter substrate-binding protein [Rhizobium lusitanum]|uniref:Aliphatic sulfonate ABC transporter substrate-binding protein n=1 Tax=Rhizobium lusitanum TaxID=293958 RepID=A0A6L9UFB7_9HYPH|nr:aliphatic sulfonate ABC transporter substrate-binding protein [Rhizobium lusitanum]